MFPPACMGIGAMAAEERLAPPCNTDPVGVSAVWLSRNAPTQPHSKVSWVAVLRVLRHQGRRPAAVVVVVACTAWLQPLLTFTSLRRLLVLNNSACRHACAERVCHLRA
jgi:hypothetical protein